MVYTGRIPMSDVQKKYMNARLLDLLNKTSNLRDHYGNDFTATFNTLPLRAVIDYYKIIKKPMSYSKMRQLVKHNRYTNPQAFVNDLVQITWNARTYNADGSDIYRQATVLDNFIKDTIIPSIEKNDKIPGHDQVQYPYLGPLPTDKISVSSTPTPTPLPMGVPETPVPSSPEMLSHQSVTTLHQDLLPSQTVEDSPTPAMEDYYDGDETKQGDEDEDDYEDGQHSSFRPGSQGSSLPNYAYNQANYVSRIEDSGVTNLYNPPRVANNINIATNSQLLEQWVKRGRPPIVDKPHEQRIKSIMRGLKKIKVQGKTIITVFDKLPNVQDHPRYYELIPQPISMLDIKGLIKQRYYNSVDAYMADVMRLINNNRTYYTDDPFMLNNISLLESNVTRLYNVEMNKPDSVYIGDSQTSKIPLSYILHQGKTYRVGNWILLKNPNDETKPIVGQIFRIWEEHGKSYINVCWYYRPEWTTHRSDKLFLENEVFKTGQYRDHPIEDIVGSCYVAYFTRWLKGDPAVPYEGPLFVCEYRYNDRELNFAKIRTWKACLPDEVRHIEDPVKLIDKPRMLKKLPSPIKHLLPPNASSRDRVPPPTICNINAPPLVGAIYIRRDDDEDDDSNYFDDTLSQSQFKTYFPPTANIRLPSSAMIESNSPTPHSPLSTSHGQFSNFNSPQQSSHVSLSGGSSSQTHLPQLSGIPTSTINPTNLMSHIPQPQHQPYTSNKFVPTMPTHTYFSGTNNPSLNHSTHSYSGGGGHKIIHSPFNNLTYQFSNFNQATYSQTFILPSNKEQGLQKFVRNRYEKLDVTNYERFNEVLKKQNYLSNGERMVSIDEIKNNIELPSMVWFRGPPQYIPNRIINSGLSEDDIFNNDLNPVLKKRRLNGDDTGANVGVSNFKLGHSAKYLAWKLNKLEEEQKNNDEENAVEKV